MSFALLSCSHLSASDPPKQCLLGQYSAVNPPPNSPKTPPVQPRSSTVRPTTPTTYFQFPPTPATPTFNSSPGTPTSDVSFNFNFPTLTDSSLYPSPEPEPSCSFSKVSPLQSYQQVTPPYPEQQLRSSCRRQEACRSPPSPPQATCNNNTLAENDYTSFLLKSATTLPELPESFVKNSLPFTPQLDLQQQQPVRYQTPPSTAAAAGPRYYCGAPYAPFYYITHGKVKARKRTAFTQLQQDQLEAAFDRKNYISTAERVQLSKDIGLSVHTILLWYQNKRARLKKRGIASKRTEE